MTLLTIFSTIKIEVRSRKKKRIYKNQIYTNKADGHHKRLTPC